MTTNNTDHHDAAMNQQKSSTAHKQPSSAWWEHKSLHEMNQDEWEQLCDHCGKCCLHKLEDMDDSTVYYTKIACRLMDAKSCHCTDYANRQTLVPDCVKLSINNLATIDWMPPSCSYRLLKEGQTLPAWHHLRTGDKQSVHQAQASVVGRFIYETTINPDDLEDYIVEWPLERPR